MSLVASFSAPYFTGASRTLEVPGKFHCSLAGRGYMIDTARLEDFTRRAIPLARQQADQSEAPGEQSLSVEELWRRSQDDWTHGAGQSFLDRNDSDNQRFRSSKGIDVWTRWQMSLLPDTTQRRASVNTGLKLTVAGDYLYAIDGSSLLYTTDLTTWTAVAGGPAGAPTHVTSDGYNVWSSHSGDGIYLTTRGAATMSSYTTGAEEDVAFVKGRLMATNGPELYNITAAGPKGTPLFEKVNTDWQWVGFAEGRACIYAAGYSGDKSLVYRITIKADATGLDAPIVAGELPDGEVVRSIYGYLGFVLLGTTQGVRFCAADDEGNLTIGALIRTPEPVWCFEGQDRFVWFGWSNYDATSTGLGRLDLSVFTAPLTPAYASDLMVTGQGVVRNIVTFGSKQVFSVEGMGFYEQSDVLVASGTLDTGLITYGLPDLKTAVYLDVKVAEPVDTNKAYVSTDGGDFVLIGTRSSSTTDPFTIGELSGETFEVRHELLNADVDTAAGPVVTRYTMRAYPRPTQGEVFTVPVLLYESIDTVNNDTHYMQPAEEFSSLVGLRESKQLVTYQIGTQSHTVMVDDAVFLPLHPTSKNDDWNGTALLRLKSFAN